MPALLARLATLGRPKAFLVTALMLWLGVGYFLLQRVPSPFDPVEPPRLVGVDGLVPFAPGAVWVYFSYYLLIPLPAFLARGSRELGRAVLGPALVALGAFAVFFLAPTVLPRPRMPEDAWGYALLVSLDRPTNAFPSLHAALSVHVGLLGERLLGALCGRWSRVAGRVGLWLWIGAILYSTLALAQHVVADLVAGALLGIVVYASLHRRAGAADGVVVRPRVARGGRLAPVAVPVGVEAANRPARRWAGERSGLRPSERVGRAPRRRAAAAPRRRARARPRG